MATYLNKYFAINDNFKSSLEQAKLWFSDPMIFNDPYDCNLKLYIEHEKPVIAEHFTLLNSHWKQRAAAGDLNARYLNEEQLEQRINQLYANPQILIDNSDRVVKDNIDSRGICCFSKRDDQLLMWSYYSDKHKGVCLKFEMEKDQQFFYLPYWVDYPDKLPQFNYLRETNKIYSGQVSGLTQFLYATKSKDWSYEEEVRIIKEKLHGSFRGLIEFKRAALVEVIFGYKACREDITIVKEILSKGNYNVTTYKMELRLDDFGIVKRHC